MFGVAEIRVSQCGGQNTGLLVVVVVDFGGDLAVVGAQDAPRVGMFIGPVVGPLADKYGNRPFMALGMGLQAIGFGWVAMVAKPGVGFGGVIGAD